MTRQVRLPANAGNLGIEALRLKRQAAAGAFDEPHLDDENAALEMARTRRVMLPQRHLACTPGNMRRWLARLGKTPAWHARWCAWGTLGDWRRHNPRCSLRSLVGLWLEEIDREGEICISDRASREAVSPLGQKAP